MNLLEYAIIFQETLDELLIQQATSTWMEDNASDVRYNGGNEVRMPKLSVQGMGTYSRTNGFVKGAVTLEFETFQLTQDRGREVVLDAMDVDETNFAASAMNVMSTFQKDKVVPEIDAYRYSTIFGYAAAANKVNAYVPTEATIFQQLKDDIATVQDIIGENYELVITMSIKAANILDKADKIEKQLMVTDFMRGDITTKVKSIDDIPIVKVSSGRFQSEFQFYDGETGGQEEGGFVKTALSMPINWQIQARRAPIAIAKQDKFRIFDPDTYQQADAWKMDYRKYHDIWITDRALDSIFVSYTAIDAPALAVTVAAGTASGSTSYTATPDAGNTLAYAVTAASITEGYLDTPSTATTAYTSGADIPGVSAGEYLHMYELDSFGRVVKYAEKLLVSGDIQP